MAETRIKSSGLSANITVSNLSLTGTTSVTGNVVPTSNNAVNLGTPTLRFGSLYLSGNTIDIGGAQITTTTGGDLSFNTASGNVAITANTVSFLTTVANTVSDSGNVAFSSNITATAVTAGAYFYSNGTAFVGGAGATGYTGSRGDTGLGFAIAKSYASVAALTADTSPTGITAGQFAVIETGNVQDADNAKLYLWSGSAYSYVTDLSGAAGITGPAGYAGSSGSAGTTGYTGSASTVVGYTGSAGTTGNIGYTGSSGVVNGGTPGQLLYQQAVYGPMTSFTIANNPTSPGIQDSSSTFTSTTPNFTLTLQISGARADNSGYLGIGYYNVTANTRVAAVEYADYAAYGTALYRRLINYAYDAWQNATPFRLRVVKSGTTLTWAFLNTSDTVLIQDSSTVAEGPTYKIYAYYGRDSTDDSQLVSIISDTGGLFSSATAVVGTETSFVAIGNVGTVLTGQGNSSPVFSNNLTLTGNVTAGAVYTNNYFYANGTPYSTAGALGYTGSAGTTGYTGSSGTSGNIGYTGSRGTTAFTAGNTAPTSPSLGDMWYRTYNDALYRYLNDGTTSYWIDVTGPVNNFGTSATTLAAITASGAAPPPTVGQFYGGGYYAGSISATGNGVATHYLIVAPKSTGETSGLTWGPQGVTTGATSVINGPSNSAILAGLGSSYQAATWCEALSINGYTDWYLPSKNELEVMYYFLKPGTGNNDIASGANPNAVSPEPLNTNYNYTVPGQTSATAFRTGASDQQLVESMYWSSTQFNDNYAFVQKFQNGEQLNDRYKDDTYLKNVRAVRRVAI